MDEKSFDQLKELVQFIGRNKIKHLSFPLSRGAKSLQHKLYYGLEEGSINNSHDISRFLFPNAKDQKASSNRLQLRLWGSLLDILFLIDTNKSKFNTLQKAYFQCYRDMVAAKILVGRFQRAIGMVVAEKAIKKAIQFEITNIIVELAQELRFYYGGIRGNRKKWKYYNELLCEWNERRQAEIIIEGYYLDIVCNFILSKSTNKEFSRVASFYLESIEDTLLGNGTVRSFSFYFMLKALKFEIENDFIQLKALSEEALKFFDSKKALTTGPIRYTFHKSLLIACIRLRKFEMAESIAAKCNELTMPGAVNWYNMQCFIIILYFQSNKFVEAWETWNISSSHPNFKLFPPDLKESWQLLEAYIQFCIRAGKIKIANTKDQPGKFRITKFLNEVPAFSKDKRGNNINILVLHILFLVERKRYNEIHDRVESLRVYASRYLRKDDMFRSNCFIRMLMCLPAGHFHKEAVLRRARPFWDKLQTVPYEKADQPIEVEIIPYETLWEIVLELLER